MFRPFAVTLSGEATLSTDQPVWEFKAPCDLTLRAVSVASAGADTDGVLNVGTAADPDGYLDAVAVGDQTPTLFDLDDFNGDLVSNQGDDYPHITAGTVISVGFDDDDSNGVDDWMIVLWFEEG